MSSYKAFEKQSIVFNAGLIKKKKEKRKDEKACVKKFLETSGSVLIKAEACVSCCYLPICM